MKLGLVAHDGVGGNLGLLDAGLVEGIDAKKRARVGGDELEEVEKLADGGGVDLRRVQTWLGHQTLQMTMRYAHLATHDLDGCVAVLEQRGV